MDADGQEIGIEVELRVVLVDVVADAGPMREQVLDGDVVVDERQVGPSTERAVVESSSAPLSIER